MWAEDTALKRKEEDIIMHEFKKITALLVSGIIVLSLTGCGGKNEATKNAGSKSEKTESVSKDGDGKGNADSKKADSGKGSDSGAYQAGEVIKLGKFEQDNDPSNGPEDIEWIVLDTKSNGDKLVMSKDALEGLPFNKIFQVTITWETCTLREWLNDDFYNSAFSDDEKAQILVSQVTTPKNEKTGKDGGNDTEDKVFLLSIDEANTYFTSNDARICHPSAFAKAKGLEAGEKTVMEGNCRWWLRSVGFTSSDTARIFEDGSVNEDGGSADRENANGVRPVMWINESGTGDANWQAAKKEGFTTSKVLAMIEAYEKGGLTIIPMTAADFGADKEKYVEGFRAEKDGKVFNYVVQFADDESARDFVENVWGTQYKGVTVDDSLGTGFTFEVPGAYRGGYCDFLGFMTFYPAET